MATYAWEKNDGGGWVPFDDQPTVANPTETFDEGTWDIRVTVTDGAQVAQKTRLGYVVAAAAPSYTGPLDLVPGAAVAYGARALSAAMLGQNIFRLRRDSDDAEMNFAADAVTGEAPVASITAWLAGATGFLVTWYDQSGSGIHLGQADEGTQMRWVASWQGGKPGFDSPADGRTVRTDSIFWTLSSGTFTGFMVSSNSVDFGTDANNTSALHFASGQDTGRPNIDIFNGDTNDEAGGRIEPTAQHTDILIYDAVCQFGNNNFRVNGANQAFVVDFDIGGPVGSIPCDLDTVLVLQETGARLGELILYDAVKSDGNRTAVRANEATYYSITLS